VIVAVLPAHRGGIAFAPALPPEYEKLAEHWPQGRLSKAYAAYETPFWRKNGCSGEALSDEGPVFITFDVSPGDAGPGILLGFTGARTFDPLPAEQLREQALEGFVTLFGDAAARPIDYVDHCWGTEEFAPGGPTAAVPPAHGRRTGRGCASRWTVFSGQAPNPPTYGPASSTARCGRASARPTRYTGHCRARRLLN
jgi:monoamine oxidase